MTEEKQEEAKQEGSVRKNYVKSTISAVLALGLLAFSVVGMNKFFDTKTKELEKYKEKEIVLPEKKERKDYSKFDQEPAKFDKEYRESVASAAALEAEMAKAKERVKQIRPLEDILKEIKAASQPIQSYTPIQSDTESKVKFEKLQASYDELAKEHKEVLGQYSKLERVAKDLEIQNMEEESKKENLICYMNETIDSALKYIDKVITIVKPCRIEQKEDELKILETHKKYLQKLKVMVQNSNIESGRNRWLCKELENTIKAIGSDLAGWQDERGGYGWFGEAKEYTSKVKQNLGETKKEIRKLGYGESTVIIAK